MKKDDVWNEEINPDFISDARDARDARDGGDGSIGWGEC